MGTEWHLGGRYVTLQDGEAPTGRQSRRSLSALNCAARSYFADTTIMSASSEESSVPPDAAADTTAHTAPDRDSPGAKGVTFDRAADDTALVDAALAASGAFDDGEGEFDDAEFSASEFDEEAISDEDFADLEASVDQRERRPERGQDRPSRGERGQRGKAVVKKAASKRSTDPEYGAERAERLQKVLAEAGYGSRRYCEELITAGRVTIDGQSVTELGTRVDPWANRVCVDGERIKLERRQYYLLNKPPGVLCTTADPSGRPRAIDLVPKTSDRLFTVGRLDENTEGLLLITNDGDLAHRLAHPRFQVERFYRALVAGLPNLDELNELTRGMYFADGKFRLRNVRRIATHGKSTLLEMMLTEGQNREIRRLLARIGHKVLRLKRVAFGPLRLGPLETGEWRPLAEPEIRALHEFAARVDRAGAEDADAPQGSRREHGDATRRPTVKRSLRIGGKRPTTQAGGRPGTPRSSSGTSDDVRSERPAGKFARGKRPVKSRGGAASSGAGGAGRGPRPPQKVVQRLRSPAQIDASMMEDDAGPKILRRRRPTGGPRRPTDGPAASGQSGAGQPRMGGTGRPRRPLGSSDGPPAAIRRKRPVGIDGEDSLPDATGRRPGKRPAGPIKRRGASGAAGAQLEQERLSRELPGRARRRDANDGDQGSSRGPADRASGGRPAMNSGRGKSAKGTKKRVAKGARRPKR